RSPYIPYLFSILHMLTFFLLYVQSKETIVYPQPAVSLQLLFLCNSFGAFLTILYVSYVSNASADIGKEVLNKQNESLLQIANYDSLTGLYNRTYLKKSASQLHLKDCCLA
ncbi:hypothetical protein NE665_24195, partial [Clostridium sp. DFI.1.208]|nr:hypothetical protein [Clostridium sp. DFI.1.208]